jgi:hypothetical protein
MLLHLKMKLTIKVCHQKLAEPLLDRVHRLEYNIERTQGAIFIVWAWQCRIDCIWQN